MRWVQVALVAVVVLAGARVALAQKAGASCAPAPAPASDGKTPAHPAERWNAWGFLMGEWEGKGKDASQGTDEFSFATDLAGSVLVRRHRAQVAASERGPATVQEDLMVVYAVGSSTRAVFFDSEGQVVQYVATIAPDGKGVTFVSDPSENVPRFRLTYALKDGGELAIRLEKAPPDRPEAFERVMEGAAIRKASRAAAAGSTVPAVPPPPPAGAAQRK